MLHLHSAIVQFIIVPHAIVFLNAKNVTIIIISVN